MSFPRYPEYRDSGVAWLGDVPSHWKITQSRRLFRERKDRATAGDRQLTASQKHGVIYQDEFMALEGHKVMQVIHGADILKRAEPNDFVISMRSFQGGIEWCGLTGSISSAYVMLIPEDSVFPGYFRYLLKSSRYIQALQSTTNLVRDGQALRFANFVLVDLPVVPRKEQVGIAAFLDRETAKIDALVAEQEKLIALLQEKLQDVIVHAVTYGLNPSVPMKKSGVEWLGNVPAHWNVGALKRYWTVKDCKHVTAEFVDEGFPLASIREVQNRWVNLDSANRTTDYFYELLIEGDRKPRAGDLIFSRNATVGEVAQVHPDHPPFAMGQDVVLLRKISENSSSDYLQQVIRSQVVVRQLANLMIGSTFKRINVEEIRQIFIPFPPPCEQIEIAAHLDSEVDRFDALISEARSAMDLLRERRAALISAAVTGQIDVRARVAVEAAA